MTDALGFSNGYAGHGFYGLQLNPNGSGLSFPEGHALTIPRESKGLSYGGRLNTEVIYGLCTGCLRPLIKGLSYSSRGSSGI